jgi:ATP-dependent DNA ligase
VGRAGSSSPGGSPNGHELVRGNFLKYPPAYVERRELLEDCAGLLTLPRFPSSEVSAADMLAVAAENGMEGIVVKRLDSTYRAGSIGHQSRMKPLLRIRKSARNPSCGISGASSELGW